MPQWAPRSSRSLQRANSELFPMSRKWAAGGGPPPPADFLREVFGLLAAAGAGGAGGHQAVLRAVDDAGAPELRRGGHDGDLALLQEAGQSARQGPALGRGQVVP